MIEKLHALFAELYALGCEHDSYAYALSDEINAVVDNAMLAAFQSDLENLFLRSKLVEGTEKYALQNMLAARMPARRRVWYKFFRKCPNKPAEAVDEVLKGGANDYMNGIFAQLAKIEWDVAVAQGGVSFPEGEDGAGDAAEAPADPAEAPQDAPEGDDASDAAEEPADPAEAPQDAPEGDGAGDADGDPGELWDEDEADEDEPPGDAE